MDSDIKIIGKLRKLEKLNLSRTKVTNNALQYICDLKELELRGCTNITDFGLKELIKSSPKLELLEVRRCKQINNIHMIFIEVICNRSSDVMLNIIK